MMLKYKIQEKRREVTVTLPVDDPDKLAAFDIKGDARLAASVRERILDSYGLRGTRIFAETTARDLHVAMSSPTMQQFKPECVEGLHLFKAWTQGK